jgi:hypothetical protein
MANLIIIRLHPVNPTDGANFTSYLNNLQIEAFDLTFGDPKKGVSVGKAKGVWTPPSTNPLDPGLHQINLTNTQIIQHFSIVTIGLVHVVKVEAVATAVIALNPPAGHHEYQTTDLRLEITNNSRKILDQNVDFNVAEFADPASTDPSTYIALDVSVFFGLPDPILGLDPTVAFVNLPADGTAPDFLSVLNAANLVLAQDPDDVNNSLSALSPLSAAQARHVSREIIWNRKLIPAPAPPRPLERLYTRPPTDPSFSGDDLKQADMDRKQFEASLMGFVRFCSVGRGLGRSAEQGACEGRVFLPRRSNEPNSRCHVSRCGPGDFNWFAYTRWL